MRKSESSHPDFNFISPTVKELIEHLCFVGAGQLSESLGLIHEIALYHSNLPLDTKEKHALLDIKMLVEHLNKISLEKPPGDR